MTVLYSILHLMVDGLCAMAMFGKYIPRENGYFYILLYNFCAFALQMPFGVLLDALNGRSGGRKHDFAFLTAAAGVLCTIAGAVTHPVLLGIGNALFHVGGGVGTIREDHARHWQGRGLGLFVAPGALGLYLGNLIAAGSRTDAQAVGAGELLQTQGFGMRELSPVQSSGMRELLTAAGAGELSPTLDSGAGQMSMLSRWFSQEWNLWYLCVSVSMVLLLCVEAWRLWGSVFDATGGKLPGSLSGLDCTPKPENRLRQNCTLMSENELKPNRAPKFESTSGSDCVPKSESTSGSDCVPKSESTSGSDCVTKSESVPEVRDTPRLHSGALRLAVCCLLVVILRSYIGMEVTFTWRTGVMAGVLSVLAVAGGKVLGGLLGAWKGTYRTAVATLTLAAFCFLFSAEMPVGLAALLLFNMTMPITLYWAVCAFPKQPGFAFGFLTFALFLGFLPVYFGWETGLAGSIAGCTGSVLSLLLLAAGLGARRWNEEGQREREGEGER